MGASVFIFVMVILPLMSISGIILLILFLFRYKGKNIKVYVTKLIAAVLIAVCIIAFMAPLKLFGDIREENGKEDSEYIDTGIMTEWDDNGDFCYDGRMYTMFEYGDGLFWYYMNKGNSYEPAFNIRLPESFYTLLFNDYAKDVMYKVPNRSGSEMYADSDVYLYCPVSEVDEVKSYYGDNKNYKWYVDTGKAEDRNLYRIELSDEEVSGIYNMKNKESVKSVDSNEIKNDCRLIKISMDDVLIGEIGIIYDGHRWFWDTEDCDENKEYVIPLPESVDNKINECLLEHDNKM